MRERERVPRVVSRADALALGLSERQIERRVAVGRWRRVLPRTYLTVDTYTWADRLDAALLFAGPEARLSGAAALIESEVVVPRPAEVLVLAPRRSGIRSVPGVRVAHPLHLPDPVQWFGPCRAPVERALADHARTLTRLDDVRTLVARAVRSGACSLPELEHELVRGQRNGSRLLRQALAEVTAGAASAPEAEAARLLRGDRRIPAFEQNVRITVPHGSYVVADFLWRARRAILEIDSVEYHLDPVDWRRTQDRHLVLTTLGFSVVHRPPSIVHEPRRFVTEVAAWLDSLPVVA